MSSFKSCSGQFAVSRCTCRSPRRTRRADHSGRAPSRRRPRRGGRTRYR